MQDSLGALGARRFLSCPRLCRRLGLAPRQTRSISTPRASLGDPAASRHLHQGDRDQDQHRLHRKRHRRAAGGGGRELAGRRHHGRRLRHADRLRRARPDPAGPFRRAGRGGSGEPARPGRPLVRDVDARARHLRLEGAGRWKTHDLRGSGRSAMEGPRVHPLRPASLQQRAVRRDDRQGRRRRDRGTI